jgi:hypothetical protein
MFNVDEVSQAAIDGIALKPTAARKPETQRLAF